MCGEKQNTWQLEGKKEKKTVGDMHRKRWEVGDKKQGE